jgi:hypothetical protein
MFTSKKMENKTFIVIKNNSSITYKGLAPGRKKKVKTDSKGVPLDRDWAKATRCQKEGASFEIVQSEPKAKAKVKTGKSTKKGD